ncbi:multidrug efflux MFS transporter [Furfurilactobacillus milii]|uniref:Multidrug efflux MFS transporter n=1 Tax=Furfurilactobacillus milii TaxID=2888272 RepID=A0ABT6DD22_9LACO|nr:multidrug efflux MFS transporter [Furfurilactobacillus milii]QLE66001.1 Multidrug-efflux transporter major facilitator MFS [Furfurilactobacillus rossiae]MCF6161741.1 multidrug efflux MFS transporter [Furfurilactobacillus milii]MCF6164144.1 multidrug efflux MFS transporter [Furfurilactobacillus milii]MDF9914687.1 multidrug efflux MFS transporter [Furfurilactobacillus milii]QLE68431.1 Multidrug-efflux transporter major facilitator superfamily MFS [Furfurilactobacillus rossiae]
MKNQNGWRRNLAVLWLGTFIAGMGFSEIMPFLSLYVDQLGTFTKGQLTIYSGVTYAVTFFVIAVVSPLWGQLADRKGRKLMLLRSSAGMAVVIALMGFVHNIWILILLRFLQGLCAGYIPNASALIATETPKSKSGSALGILTTGYVSGNLIGPILGGTLAAIFSIRMTFFITGFLLAVVFFLSLFLVHEHFTPIPRAKMQSTKEVFASFKSARAIVILLISTMLIQMGNNSITPILSLYVRELMSHTANLTIVAGIIAALPGISTLVSAPQLGRLGDRIGTEKVLMGGFIFAVLMYFPQGFVSTVGMLGVLRFMIGISDGALFPTVQTLLVKNSPLNVTGRVFSWNQSFQALGSMLGSLLGGFVSNLFDYRGVFVFTAIALAADFLLVYIGIPSTRFHFHASNSESSN